MKQSKSTQINLSRLTEDEVAHIYSTYSTYSMMLDQCPNDSVVQSIVDKFEMWNDVEQGLMGDGETLIDYLWRLYELYI